MNLQLTCKFVVAPMYMAPYDLSDMVLVVGASSCVSAYVQNSTLKCLVYSKVESIIMVLEEYFCGIPSIGGKSFSHITTNRIISMTMRPGDLLNGRVIHMSLTHSLIALIYLYIYGIFSADVVVFRVDLPGIIIWGF